MITLNNKHLCENCFSETSTEPCPHCGFVKSEYRHDPVTLVVGSILSQRYMIGGVVGKGGFGITYLAYDLKLDARVAVKEYYPMGLAIRNPGSTAVTVSNRESGDSFRTGAEKFYNEAKMVAKFNGNPNIVSVHDFFYENDTVYFIMGYLQGQTLKSYLKNKKITEGQAVNILDQISNALFASHSMNILHRDVSPDNIMLCDDGTIRLLDFGAARQVVAEQSQSLSVILKQGFAPLEQYQKKGKQGPWTDIYALGATIYTALTGEMLNDPMSRLEDDSEYAANRFGISEPLWNIIYKCTKLKIADRYQNIEELKGDLSNVGIESEKFNDIEEEITDFLRGNVPEGSTLGPGIVPNFAPAADPNATVLLSESQPGQSNETMALSPEAAAAYMGAQSAAAQRPTPQTPPQQPLRQPMPAQPRQVHTGQPVTGGVTGQPMPAQPQQVYTGQPVTGGVTGQPMPAQPQLGYTPVQSQAGQQPQMGAVPQSGYAGRPGVQPQVREQLQSRKRTARGKQPYQYQPKMTGKNIKPLPMPLIIIIIIAGILFWMMTFGSAIVSTFAEERSPAYEYHAEEDDTELKAMGSAVDDGQNTDQAL